MPRGIAKHCSGKSNCRCMSCIIKRRRARQSEQNKRRWERRSAAKWNEQVKLKKAVRQRPVSQYKRNRYGNMVVHTSRLKGEPSIKQRYREYSDADVVEMARSRRYRSDYENSVISKEYKARQITKKFEKATLKGFARFDRSKKRAKRIAKVKRIWELVFRRKKRR